MSATESPYEEGVFPLRLKRPIQKATLPDASSARKQRKAAKADALKNAYAEVDKRDGGVCWVTGVQTSPAGRSEWDQRTHHHLRGRNVKPEWRHDPDRIITVSLGVHRLLDLDKIIQEGDDARKPIRFHWNPSTPPEQRTCRIKSRRRSQQVDE